MKLVIFDLDGVLVKTEHHHTFALQKAIDQIAPNARNASYLGAADGLRTVDKLAKLKLEYQLTDEQITAIDTLKQQITADLLCSIEPNFMLVEQMTKLKQRGILLGIASNTRRHYLDIITKALGICDLMACTVAGNEVVHGKPHPECFKTVMATLGVDPQHTVVFEDSFAGIQAAIASGANVIAVDPKTLITLEQFNQL